MVFGTLSIGTLIGYEKNKLQQYLKEFSNTYPNISMDICTNEITELLNLVKNNSMDLAFVINPENQPLKDFEYKTVERYSLVALLPPGHPLYNEDSIDLIELQHDKFIFVKETGDEYGQKSMIQNRYQKQGLYLMWYNVQIILILLNHWYLLTWEYPFYLHFVLQIQ